MIRFKAPSDITAAWLSIGPVAVNDGTIALPVDLPPGDLRGLAAAGFVALPPLFVAATEAAPLKPKRTPHPEKD